MNDVTRILCAIGQGDPDAASQLLPLVYEELRALAARRLARDPAGRTFQATELVHEAYVRLVQDDSPGASDQKWDGRGHFFAAAAEAMRRILVESARRKGRIKHGGGRQRFDLEEYDLPVAERSDEVLALDEALTRLAAQDALADQVVRLHFFAGLSIEDAAQSLGISRATAFRQWSYARAWLRCAMGDVGNHPE